MLVKFHSFHTWEAHKLAFKKMFFLLALAFIPQWVNLLLCSLGAKSPCEFLSLNDALIYSFSFLPPAIFMLYDIVYGSNEDTSKAAVLIGIQKSYFWIFFAAVIILFINIILYTILVTLAGKIKIHEILSQLVTYITFTIAIYIWYTTILYQNFDFSNEDFVKKTTSSTNNKIALFEKDLTADEVGENQ